MKVKSTFLNQLLKNAKGSTIVQMLVVTGVIGALSVAVSTMISNINKSQTATENAQYATEVEDLIQMALRTNASCQATVDGTARVGGAGAALGSINESFGGIVNPIVAVNQVLGGELLTIEGSGVGAGPRLTVNDIRLITEAGNTPVTTYENGVEQNMNVANATVRVTFTRGDSTDADNASMQAQQSYGSTQIFRDFPVQVLVDGTNTIINCYTREDNVGENVCNSVSGIYGADGKCREISIEVDPAAVVDANGDTSNYAITSRQAMLVRSDGIIADPTKGGLTVSDPPPAVMPGPGNMRVQNDLTVGVLPSVGNAQVGVNMLVEGTGQINGNTAIGIAVNPDPTEPRLRVSGNGARITRADGNVLSLLENQGVAIESEIQLTNNSGGAGTTSIRVDSTVTAGQLLGLYIAGAERFRVSDMGRVFIPAPAAASDATNPVAAIDIGLTSNTVYYGWRIFNQPADPNISSHWVTSGTRGQEVATKRWAANSVYASLSNDPEAVGDITATILSYSENNQILAIRRMICESSRTQQLIGESPASAPFATGVFQFDAGSGAWRCDHRPVACTSTARCGNIFVTGINSTGQILATGAGASVRVINSGDVILNNNGTITATSTISSATEVTAPTMHGTSTAFNEGVCSANGCSQRFGHQFCPFGQVALGMDRGTLVCGGGFW